MAQFSAQVIAAAGTVPTFAACNAGGDTFVNDGATVLHFKNGSGGAITVTVTATGPCEMGSIHDFAFQVGPASEAIVGAFDVLRFGVNPAITYSGVTSLTAAVYQSVGT